ncbi:MAG: TIGR01777 family oxidoreductase [Planctomycetota bacterium]
MNSTFIKESFLSVPKRDLFAFHEQPDAFSLLTRKSDNIEVISTASTLKPSSDVVRFIAHFLFFRFRFAMIHTEYEPPDLFVDEQKEGLFTRWRHEHRFIEAGWKADPATLLQDRIDFAHPLLFLFRPFVHHRLKSMFAFRHGKTAEEVHGKAKKTQGHAGTRVIVTGATGLIGKRITRILRDKGVSVTAFVRDVEKAHTKLGHDVECVHWDFHKPHEGTWKERIQGADAIIHLAGTPLFKQRWTPAFKEEMEQSRVLGTRQLVEAVKAADHKPRAFVSASAVGIYGTDPDRTVDENTGFGDDLLARICIHWENEACKLNSGGIRSAQIRIGIVLSTESGAIKEMLPLFRAGMGGIMGYPHHWINWIHLEDMARIFVMAAFNEEMHGPFNAVAPAPVQMRTFSQIFARTLRRPCLMRYPVPILKMIIGEAGEYSSGGPRADCGKLEKTGYSFFFTEIGAALTNILA